MRKLTKFIEYLLASTRSANDMLPELFEANNEYIYPS
jgi:hypothetical protein